MTWLLYHVKHIIPTYYLRGFCIDSTVTLGWLRSKPANILGKGILAIYDKYDLIMVQNAQTGKRIVMI